MYNLLYYMTAHRDYGSHNKQLLYTDFLFLSIQSSGTSMDFYKHQDSRTLC